MPRPKGENNIRKHFKLTEETARILEEQSKAEGMNESEYIRYLLLNQSKHPRSKELELEENNNSHMYSDSDKIKLICQLDIVKDLLEGISSVFI